MSRYFLLFGLLSFSQVSHSDPILTFKQAQLCAKSSPHVDQMRQDADYIIQTLDTIRQTPDLNDRDKLAQTIKDKPNLMSIVRAIIEYSDACTGISVPQSTFNALCSNDQSNTWCKSLRDHK